MNTTIYIDEHQASRLNVFDNGSRQIFTANARCLDDKHALSRIAKEGRKYGVGLGLISQRPSELAETLLSQCNTLIALRMSNEQDQNFVRRALPDGVRSLVDVLPTLRAQEALVVGEGTAVPVRLKFKDLEEQYRLHSSDVPFANLWKDDENQEDFVSSVVQRWRMQTRE
jgi:DNA helicase HerA-like ATPase